MTPRVAALKQQIEHGEYCVDPAAVAVAMIQRGEQILDGHRIARNGYRDKEAARCRMAHAREHRALREELAA